MVYNLWKTLKDDSLNFFTELIFQNFSPDSIDRLNSGIFRIFELGGWNLNLNSSDCGASKIIWNDIKLERIPWVLIIENRLCSICVGVWVGGHHPTDFSSVLDKNLSVLIWMYVFEVLFMIEMGSKVTLIVLYPLHMNLLVRIRYHLFGWMEINRVRSRDLEHTFDFAHLDFKHDPMMTESSDFKWPEK